MAGTREGGLKAAATLKKRNPKFYVQIGSEGGKQEVEKGYSMNRTLASLSGFKGAKIRKERYDEAQELNHAK
jgi:uncharacterized protein